MVQLNFVGFRSGLDGNMEELTSGKTVGVLNWSPHYIFNLSETSRSMIGCTARAC